MAIVEKWKVTLEGSGIRVVIGGHDAPSPRGGQCPFRGDGGFSPGSAQVRPRLGAPRVRLALPPRRRALLTRWDRLVRYHGAFFTYTAQLQALGVFISGVTEYYC